MLSDHGEEFWDHGSVLHSHTVFQELVHVPLVIRLPGGRLGGQRIKEPVALMDVVPTILDVLGVPGISAHQGTSLMGRIGKPGSSATNIVVSEIDPFRAFTEWPMKVISNVDSGAIDLYDLAKDPGERIDLALEDFDLAVQKLKELAPQVDPLGEGAVRALESVPNDDVLKEQLRALGYIE